MICEDRLRKEGCNDSKVSFLTLQRQRNTSQPPRPPRHGVSGNARLTKPPNASKKGGYGAGNERKTIYRTGRGSRGGRGNLNSSNKIALSNSASGGNRGGGQGNYRGGPDPQNCPKSVYIEQNKQIMQRSNNWRAMLDYAENTCGNFNDVNWRSLFSKLGQVTQDAAALRRWIRRGAENLWKTEISNSVCMDSCC